MRQTDRFIVVLSGAVSRGAFRSETQRCNHVDEDKTNALEPDGYRVAYVVRAVTLGRFVRPETVVEDMYRPEVMARTAASAITVSRR